MTTILLYLLVQFNIGTSDTTENTITAEYPTQYIQNSEGGSGGWDDGE